MIGYGFGRQGAATSGWARALVFAAAGCVLFAYAVPAGASLFPLSNGSGTFSYNGTSLSVSGTVSMILYSTTPGDSSPPKTDPVRGGAIQLSGMTRVGETYQFTDGTCTITAGATTVLQADIVNVLMVPTAAHTATINASAAAINLENVLVTQPTGGSTFVTKWLAAAPGSDVGAGFGKLGLSLTNTNTGSLNPLVAPASGPMNFQLEPAVPEPMTILLLLGGGAWGLVSRRRK